MENEADGVIPVSIPVAVGKPLGGFVVYDQIAGAVMIETANDVQKCGLAAAGMAKDRNKFIFPEFEINTFEGMDNRITGFIVFSDLAEFKHGDSLLCETVVDIKHFLLYNVKA